MPKVYPKWKTNKKLKRIWNSLRYRNSPDYFKSIFSQTWTGVKTPTDRAIEGGRRINSIMLINKIHRGW